MSTLIDGLEVSSMTISQLEIFLRKTRPIEVFGVFLEREKLKREIVANELRYKRFIQEFKDLTKSHRQRFFAQFKLCACDTDGCLVCGE